MSMNATGMRRWAWVHRWSSLVCTLFMLLLCLTGLPLIFHHEINDLLHPELKPQAVPAGTPLADLDRVLASAQARHPALVPQYLFREPDEPALWLVSFGETAASTEGGKTVVVDAHTARVMGEPDFESGFLYVVLKLHTDLFAGLPGKLFLGAMGLLLIVAIVSGVVLYGPFTRKLAFGTLRLDRSPRIRWLDLHNLLGIVTLAWALVVGATGVINTWADLVIKFWQFDQMAQMTAPYATLPPLDRRGPLAPAAARAQALEPQMDVGFIAFPGTLFSSPHHYAVFMRGTEPFSARLFKPVLVDARTAQVTDSRTLAWYVTALLVSQPLHFGDYGGLPMKIIWALLDLATIFVLGSGLYLWARRRAPRSLAEEAGADVATAGVMRNAP